MKIALFGASGGLGQAFLNLFCDLEEVSEIYSYSRSNISPRHKKHRPFNLAEYSDLCLNQAAKQQMGKPPFDLILATTGLLHQEGIYPEKSLKEFSLETVLPLLEANTFTPALIAKNFIPLLNHQQRSIFAALSARVGSISDNHLGGWYSYRLSKAALNMFIKTAAIEYSRKNKQGILLGLHPGTVDTELSKPFQKSVPKDKLFSPEQSALYLWGVLQKATAEQTGRLYDWQNKEIAP